VRVIILTLHRFDSHPTLTWGILNTLRFLNPQVISTIPFYMDLHFDNVLMTPIIHTMLPPSSFVRDREDSLSGAGMENTLSGSRAEPSALMEKHVDMKDMLRTMAPHAANLEEVTLDHAGQMHLQLTMNTVLACKEAMWEQFEVCCIRAP
jgi:hypothetical protein